MLDIVEFTNPKDLPQGGQWQVYSTHQTSHEDCLKLFEKKYGRKPEVIFQHKPTKDLFIQITEKEIK